MRKVVISLGGSLVVPNDVDYEFLLEFKKAIKKFKNYKFVIVTGGGKIAREYIYALRDKSEKVKSLIGIKTTKLNAMLVSNFLDSHLLIPDSLQMVGKLLEKSNIVVCGAIGYHPHMTSDGTAADIARYLKADYMINITNVKGLYNKDPKKFKDAKFIPEIGFKDFLKMANKVKFKAGQHFVLDQSGAKIMNKYKIKTVIIEGVDNLEKCLNGDNFIGTVIS